MFRLTNWDRDNQISSDNGAMPPVGILSPPAMLLFFPLAEIYSLELFERLRA